LKINKIDKNLIGTKILYPYSLVGKIEKLYNRANAKVSFTIDEINYSYDAISTELLQDIDELQPCLITFNQGKISQPIITGIIQSIKNEPLVISSDAGILLKSGDTRIELGGDGTLDLHARHINSQAYGPYRIKGASVKIN
jgi:hypothetical protein